MAKITWNIEQVRPSLEDEVFRIGYQKVDVSRLLTDIATEVLEPSMIFFFEREDIENYVNEVLRHGKERDGQSISVSESYAAGLGDSDLMRPLVAAELSDGVGTLQIEELGSEGLYTLIDGNHRVLKAYKDETPRLLAYAINAEQIKSYLSIED